MNIWKDLKINLKTIGKNIGSNNMKRGRLGKYGSSRFGSVRWNNKNWLRKNIRQELIHAAGCVVENCITVLCYKFPDEETKQEVIQSGSKIPRSLRNMYK